MDLAILTFSNAGASWRRTDAKSLYDTRWLSWFNALLCIHIFRKRNWGNVARPEWSRTAWGYCEGQPASSHQLGGLGRIINSPVWSGSSPGR